MTKEYTPEEIKYRLSDLGVQIGNIAINYITELEKACDETQELLDKQIEATYKLEKENAELKAKNKWYSEQVCNKECAEVWGQLTEVKDALRMVIDSYNHKERFSFEKDLIKAEQFLNSEVDKC